MGDFGIKLKFYFIYLNFNYIVAASDTSCIVAWVIVVIMIHDLTHFGLFLPAVMGS